MNTSNVRQHLILAAALLVCSGSSAQAQFAGLKKRMERAVAGKPENAPLAPGAARATATIEWTVETIVKGDGGCVNNAASEPEVCSLGALSFPPTPKALRNGISTPGTLTDRERGRIAIELEFDDPNALPGGMVSRMIGGPLYPVGLTMGAPTGAHRAVSFSGTVSFDRQVRPTGKCHRLGTEAGSDAGRWIDPVTVDANGQSDYTRDDIAISIAFKGDTPVALDFSRPATVGKPMGVGVAGKGSYACGTTFAFRDTANSAGHALNVADGVNGWIVRTERTPTGYKLVARSEERDNSTDAFLHPLSRRVLRTATLVWTAPPAPQAAQPGTMAPPPTFHAGKGSITFVQGGKEATWPMRSVMEMNQPMASGATFMYTPDGGQPSDERGVLALSITTVMGQTMVGFNVTKGPGGDSAFEAGECTVQVKPSTGKLMSGSGECRKDGTVVKFTFTSAR